MASSSTVCLYYMRGSCRFGNRCWNSHDLGSLRTASSYQMDDESESSDEDFSFAVEQRRETTPMTDSPSASKPRQTNKVPPNSANKLLGTNETASSTSKDKWCLKNINTGESRTGTPDGVLVETVKKLNEADNLVVSLRQQLRVKNEKDNFSWMEHQMEQCLESDLQCNICYEMFIKPTVLNCSHTFCQECIESWTRRVNHCPICRVYVKNKSYCLTLDTYLDKISVCLPEEIKERRETLKIERNNNRVNRHARRRNPPRNQSMRQTLGVLWGGRERDGVEWNIALEEALFDPVRLGDVIGRNRDDRDDWDDELSDSTLDDSYEYFCSYCDNMGHSASNCPISIMEETDDIW